MLYSKLLIPTLKEDPSEAEVVSHRLMLRAGMIRKLAAGIYTYLPLGLRVIKKVSDIVRQEMDRAGAQEILMPAVQPAELWVESGRWGFYGKELLRLKDRHDREFCIGPTHEEVVTDLVRREVKSYRQLPINLYQIQTKFRDEIRPRFGLMRGREFIMKDAYSFHKDEAQAEAEYWNMYETYKRIFTRFGLNFRAVEADTGNIGGKFSHEFHVLAETGEDFIASCTACEYAANIEKAAALPPAVAAKAEAMPLERVTTPGMKTVEEVSGFMGVTSADLVKTLIYSVMLDKWTAVAVLVRGDHELNEIKLQRVTGATEVVLADKATVERVTAAPSGFAGPVGLSGVKVYADHAVSAMANFITGGNEGDLHLRNVNTGRDFEAPEFADLRKVVAGDTCPRCGSGSIEIHKGIEVGHVFMLGTKYSEAMGCTFLDEDGSEKPMIMGCYGIGVGRTAAAAIEQNNDEFGMKWPAPIAPFGALVLPLNVKDAATMETANAIYNGLRDAGMETLMDDRDERAGFKFKDADLIGIPVRVVIGEKNLKDGNVEIKLRMSGEVQKVSKDDAVSKVLEVAVK
ncbi:MAG: proline--tRNA ligase [Nitrospirae bacterium]|nr:proline--tRNA ligase [Nitrospirota bacterium]